MANAKIDNNPKQTEQDGSIRVIQWLLTTADPNGVPVAMAEWADKTIEVDGTTNDATYGQLAFGGATLTIEGSNNGVLGTSFQNKLAVSNAAGGAALSGITANKLAAIIENPLYIAPRLSAVGVGAVILVTLIMRRNNTMRK